MAVIGVLDWVVTRWCIGVLGCCFGDIIYFGDSKVVTTML